MTQSPLWSSADIAHATGGTPRGDFLVTGLENNTRLLQPGDLYIALAGLGRHDGHDFITDAFAKGAHGVLISKDPCDNSILVDDTLLALKQLGFAARNRIGDACRIVAITGSVGKTTTRALTAQALGIFGKLHASINSLNNHWGVPLSLARMPADTQYGVFEVGMNHANEIEPLTQQIRPHVAIITTIEAAHIGNFSDGIEGIARAKAEIFAGLEPGGAAVLNIDNPQFDILQDEAQKQGVNRIITFSQTGPADLRLVSYERLEQGGRVTAHIAGDEIVFDLPLRGPHNAMNALAALGAVHALGLDVKHAAQAFAAMDNVEGRGNAQTLTIPGHGTITLIDDQHNASPVSMQAAIREFAQMPVKGRRILAIGDMRELGDSGAQMHRDLGPVIGDSRIDLTLSCGPLMHELAQTLPARQSLHYADSQVMADDIINHLRDGDTILLKASRSLQLNLVVDALNRIGQTV